MRLARQMLSRWVREFAAGVDAGNAIRLGLPVRGDVLRDGNVLPAATAIVPGRFARVPTNRRGA